MNPLKRFILLCSLSLFVLVLPVFIQQIQKTQSLLDQAAVVNGPPSLSGKQFTLLAPGASLPSGSDCAQRVRRTSWEPRPGNTNKNQYTPIKESDYKITLYNGSNNGIWIGDHPQRANVLLNRLDGNFTGTTDEILQWAACKWGADEDHVRAQAVVESNWDMGAVGDNGESYGILQVRTTAHGDAFPGAQKSTAFNADYTFMRWRMCYEGLVDFLGQTNSAYGAGDSWGCMGTWYTGNWYGDGGGYGGGAQNYINVVKQRLSERTWEQWSGVQITNVPVSPTTRPTSQPSSIPTGVTTGKKITLSLSLHGLGKGGDNVNGQATGNMQPLRQQRLIELEFFNSANISIGTRQGNAVYNASTGIFAGNVDIATIPSGQYTLKIKLSQFLKRSIPGIISVPAGNTTIQVAPFALVTGDVNDDNRLSILDYNVILDCFSDLTPAKNCGDTAKKQRTDITDDGNVNQFDYNLFLRELSVQSGS